MVALNGGILWTTFAASIQLFCVCIAHATNAIIMEKRAMLFENREQFSTHGIQNRTD